MLLGLSVKSWVSLRLIQPTFTVKQISEHKTLKMVERYSHQNGKHIRKARVSWSRGMAMSNNQLYVSMFNNLLRI